MSTTQLRKRTGFSQRPVVFLDAVTDSPILSPNHDSEHDGGVHPGPIEQGIDAVNEGSSISEEGESNSTADEDEDEEDYEEAGEEDDGEDEETDRAVKTTGVSTGHATPDVLAVNGGASEKTNGHARTRPSLDIPAEPSPSASRSTDRRRKDSSDSLEREEARKERSWYQFDVAVIIALISPLGNLLTGGDHVRNLLLVLLTVFYLHNVIEIPWSLYHSARPRRRAAHFPSPASRDSTEARYHALASSELQRMELLFLTLTILSPFLGALLLRRISDVIFGTNVISWFSTGLFVLATGIRPWSHLIDRLKQRTTDLHDMVHYPSADAPASMLELPDLVKEMQSTMKRMEEEMQTLRDRLDEAVDTEEMHETVDEAIDGFDKSLRKQERRIAAGRNAQDARIASLENTIETMRAERAIQISAAAQTSASSGGGVGQGLLGWVRTWFATESECYQKTRRPAAAPLRMPSSSLAALGSPRLETIPEDYGFGATRAVPTRIVKTSSSSSASRKSLPPPTLVHVPGLALLMFLVDLATMPVRMLKSMLGLPSAHVVKRSDR